MRVFDVLDLHERGVFTGKHGVWIPSLQVKVPFQFGGQIQKYQMIREQKYPLKLLEEEVGMLRWLAERKMAPPIGDWVYFKTVISEHPGAWWADPLGAYGYRMGDAESLPPGALANLEEPVSDVIKRTAGELISGSPGAWNDLNKHGNVINGYLVDARRSGWDRLRWHGPMLGARWEPYVEYEDSLVKDLHIDGQFPFRDRELPYQEYYLGGWREGEREVRNRAKIFGFAPQRGEQVLDIGCQIGGFLHYAAFAQGWLERPGDSDCTLIGVDTQAEYVDLARRLARANGFNICYRVLNVDDQFESLCAWIDQLWGDDQIDHLLMLSMLKHLRGGESRLWEIVNILMPGMTYLETNAVKEGTIPPLLTEVEARGGVLAGFSRDRNIRACYRIPYKP